MVSGSVSPFLSKCFSPFPHGTGPLSVSSEYLALPDGPGGFAQNSSCSALLRIPLCLFTLRVRGFHPLRPDFPVRSTHDQSTTSRSYNPGGALPRHRFGLFPVRSPLLGESFIYFLFLRVLRCFSSPRWLPRPAWMTVLQTAGLSHSEISGSTVICTCPELFAAYHVLHSLDEPRHPPCALSYFFRCPRPIAERWTLLILSAVLYCPGICISAYASLSLELCYFTVLACVNMSKIF